MDDPQPLLDYLMVAPPALPTAQAQKRRRGTSKSNKYSWKDIKTVGTWKEFSYARIIRRYGSALRAAQIESEPMPDPPSQAINAESMLSARFATYVHHRVRRSLRAGFKQLAPRLARLKLTPMTVDVGDSAETIDNYRPDIAFFQTGGPLGDCPNRCPGDLKVSWKWSSEWKTAKSLRGRREYLQVLSQVNFYMKQHKARYGFVLTDTELVPIKRLDKKGNLLVARAIRWEKGGPRRLTVPLGLWYLGMLGAEDNNWQLL